MNKGPTVEVPVAWFQWLLTHLEAYDKRRSDADAFDAEGQVTDAYYSHLKGYIQSAEAIVERGTEDGDASRS